jgi:signal transduction histidine kinase
MTSARSLPVTAESIDGVDATDEKILISFSDITEFRRSAEQLAAAKQAAEQANLVTSRFLAAASHDLRQPLQAMSLWRGPLRRRLTDPEALSLIEQADPHRRRWSASWTRFSTSIGSRPAPLSRYGPSFESRNCLTR